MQFIPRHSVLCAVGYDWSPAGYKQDKVLRVGPVPELGLSSYCLTIRVRVHPVQELV